MNNKMAIIGDGDSVFVFSAAAIDTFIANSGEEAKTTIKTIEKKYKIIFVVDTLAKEIDDFIKNYLVKPYPIILSVPSKNGSNGYGTEGIKKAMEKVLGVDILFSNSNKEED